MPMFEFRCLACGRESEALLWRWDDPNPICQHCFSSQERLASRFASPFSGSIQKYTDLKREGSHMDGFWAYKKKSSISGQPEPVYLSSMSEVRDFNKAEGLAAPGEIPTNCTISADGRTIESRGMKGQWAGSMPELPARLREMISTPADQCSPMAATSSPCMPLDYGMRVEAVTPPAEMNS